MVIKTLYHSVDSNLGVEISSKEGLIEGSFLPGRGANDLPWGKKGFPGGPGVGTNYTD